MKASPAKYAQALFELVKDKNEKEAKEVLKSFARVLFENKDFAKLDSILEHFKIIWNKKSKNKDVELISPFKLDKDALTMLNKYLNELSQGKDVNIKEKIDKSLIGGFIVRDGDKVYDASLKTKINKLKEQLQN